MTIGEFQKVLKNSLNEKDKTNKNQEDEYGYYGYYYDSESERKKDYSDRVIESQKYRNVEGIVSNDEYGNGLEAYLKINEKVYAVPPRFFNFLDEDEDFLNGGHISDRPGQDLDSILSHFSFVIQEYEEEKDFYDYDKPDLMRKYDIVTLNLLNDVIIDYYYDIFSQYLTTDMVVKNFKFEMSDKDVIEKLIKNYNSLNYKLYYIDDLLEKIENQYKKNEDKDIEELPKRFFNIQTKDKEIFFVKFEIDKSSGTPEIVQIPTEYGKQFNGFKVNGENKAYQKGLNRKEAIKVLKDSNLLNKETILKFSSYIDKYC